MSSYIVENKMIDRILTYLQDNEKELKYIPWLKQPLTTEALTGLGKDMMALNIKAFMNRYPDEENIINTYQQLYRQRENKYQYLQSLTCFLYQCNEGEIAQMDIYKTFEKVRLHMMNKIIADIPEMKTTLWE